MSNQSLIKNLLTAHSNATIQSDADGRAINPEPKTSFMMPVDVSVSQAHSSGFMTQPQTSGFMTPAAGFALGYTCLTCGAWVPNGIAHSCALANQMNFPRVELKPHRCPVCEGRGAVPFNPLDPLAITRDQTSWPCKPCTATGIVWS